MANKKYIIEVEPGDKLGIDEPEDYIHPKLKSHLPSKEKLDKLAALKEKMAALEEELQALKSQMLEKHTELRDTEKEHRASDITDPKIIKLASMIQRDCKQALTGCQKANGFLYRGIRKKYNTATSDYESNAPDIFVGKPREDRSAKDSKATIQIEFDKMLTQSGFKALRSNSIFCSGNYQQAEGYGKAYVIFPKDGFSFMWSPIYHDLYSDLLSDAGKQGIASLYKPKELLKASNQLRFYFTNFYECLESIRAHAESYIPDSEEDEVYQNALASDPERMEKLKKFIPNKKDVLLPFINELVADTYQFIQFLRGYDSDQDPKTVVGDLYTIINRLKEIDKLQLVPKLSIDSYSWPYGNQYAGSNFLTKDFLKYVKMYISGLTAPKPDVTTIIRKSLQFSDKHFDKALKSGNEICVTGEYYAVSYDEYVHILGKIFGVSNI